MSRIATALALATITVDPALAATPTADRDSGLRLHLTAAVDGDCDGDLSDEPEENARFGTEKMLEAGQCIVYRTDYSNEGDFAIRRVELRTPVPEFMVYRPGSAAHVETPPGLLPDAPKTPAGGRGGDMVWSFRGGLGPGETGRVEFHVRLDPVGDRVDFYREVSD